ncbi:MAG: class I SAM-dependent methyltransferase [Candidatus Nanohaloarchaea archaeon]
MKAVTERTWGEKSQLKTYEKALQVLAKFNFTRYSLEALVEKFNPKAFYNGDFVEFKEQGFFRQKGGRPEFSAGSFREREIIFELVTEYVETPCEALELGCGYGRHTPYIEMLTGSLTAVEPDIEAVKKAANYYPEVDFVNGKVQNLSFEDNSFDFIFSWTVLQHIPPSEIDNALEEVRRVLKPEGVVLSAHTVYGSGSHWWGRKPEFYSEKLDAEILRSQPKPEIEGVDEQDHVSVYKLRGEEK